MSKHHVKLSGHRWERVRRAALRRAGYRSERSGQAGRLEVHHKTPLECGGAPYDMDNLEVLTRREHIEEHQTLPPERAAWFALVRAAFED